MNYVTGSHAMKFGITFDKNGFTSFNQRTGDPSKITGMPAKRRSTPRWRGSAAFHTTTRLCGS